MYRYEEAQPGSILVGVGGYGMLPKCRHKEGVDQHVDPPEPEIEKASIEEVRRYVEEMKKNHTWLFEPCVAYFMTPEFLWRQKKEEAEWELFKLSLPRGAEEQYWSFTGHFLAPKNIDGLRRLERVAHCDRITEKELLARAPEGIRVRLESTNVKSIVYLYVGCPDAGWGGGGFVYNGHRQNSSACCAGNPHGGAWRYYLPVCLNGEREVNNGNY